MRPSSESYITIYKSLRLDSGNWMMSASFTTWNLSQLHRHVESVRACPLVWRNNVQVFQDHETRQHSNFLSQLAAFYSLADTQYALAQAKRVMEKCWCLNNTCSRLQLTAASLRHLQPPYFHLILSVGFMKIMDLSDYENIPAWYNSRRIYLGMLISQLRRRTKYMLCSLQTLFCE